MTEKPRINPYLLLLIGILSVSTAAITDRLAQREVGSSHRGMAVGFRLWPCLDCCTAGKERNQTAAGARVPGFALPGRPGTGSSFCLLDQFAGIQQHHNFDGSGQHATALGGNAFLLMLRSASPKRFIWACLSPFLAAPF